MSQQTARALYDSTIRPLTSIQTVGQQSTNRYDSTTTYTHAAVSILSDLLNPPNELTASPYFHKHEISLSATENNVNALSSIEAYIHREPGQIFTCTHINDKRKCRRIQSSGETQSVSIIHPKWDGKRAWIDTALRHTSPLIRWDTSSY
ncbi:uncharacterized protein BO96DRAFT_438241 [Aspergillus niger CBS 101883]|uniref:uncharacterized protein n=1 Tax=Aspergillus lacticoffeatus (strain CBS 101883) TaxID=1450533 RepID=UPI000D802A48|nr:uncharacterized protein BO96DRAFT_438241 [Aspergillus niger CBS 101883]PYH52195.1 hypothetical protein BO96DRAFT_438241 [Aspergillus niger CBS 101883]